MRLLKLLRSQAAFRVWLLAVVAVAWGLPMMQAEPSLRINDAYFYVFAVWLGVILINAVFAFAGSAPERKASKDAGKS